METSRRRSSLRSCSAGRSSSSPSSAGCSGAPPNTTMTTRPPNRRHAGRDDRNRLALIRLCVTVSIKPRRVETRVTGQTGAAGERYEDRAPAPADRNAGLRLANRCRRPGRLEHCSQPAKQPPSTPQVEHRAPASKDPAQAHTPTEPAAPSKASPTERNAQKLTLSTNYANSAPTGSDRGKRLQCCPLSSRATGHHNKPLSRQIVVTTATRRWT